MSQCETSVPGEIGRHGDAFYSLNFLPRKRYREHRLRENIKIQDATPEATTPEATTCNRPETLTSRCPYRLTESKKPLFSS